MPNIEKICVFIYSAIIMSSLCEKVVGWKRSWVMVEKVMVQNSLWTCDIELSTNNPKKIVLDVRSLGLMWLCIGLFINSINNMDIIIQFMYNL